jgi:hypothetical protein
MSLIGNIIADAFSGNPSIINYDMFVAVFAMLSLFYLIAISFNEAFMGHGAIPLLLDVLNTIFFFCGAVATAAKLGVHSCGNKVGNSAASTVIYSMLTLRSITWRLTVSPTALTTVESVAVRPKLQQPSCSSGSPALQYPPSSPSSVRDLMVSTFGVVESGEVGPSCLRSR